MIGFSVCLEFSLCLFNHVYTSTWTTQCLEILDKMPHLTCCRTILYPRWEEFCKDMSGLLLWADQLWKCTGLISLRRGDVQRHNTCWYFAQVVQTHGHALQSGKNSKEKHGSCSIWNFRCWQEDMIGTIYSAISWNFSGTITKEEKKKKKRSELICQLHVLLNPSPLPLPHVEPTPFKYSGQHWSFFSYESYPSFHR